MVFRVAKDKAPTRPGSQPNDTPSGTATDTGGGGKDPVQAAIDREKEYRSDAADRYMSQAQNLRIQAKYWREILSKKGFKKALMQKLENVDLRELQQDTRATDNYKRRYGSLKDAAGDNEKDVSAKTNANLMNASRERANALSEAALQGAGESDVLRSQGAALRNWAANQNEVGRAYFDTQTALNSSLTDLNVDVGDQRFNIAQQANESREMLWSNYYDRRSEALTQLGNTMGEISNYYAMANEQEGSKKRRDLEDEWRDKAKDTYGKLAKNTQKAWDDPGVSKKIRKWEGRDPFEDSMNNRQFGPQDTAMKRPSGADLRKW